MSNTYITIKKAMNQVWDSNGKRHAVTILTADPVVVTQVKTNEKEGYQAIKVGIGQQKESRLSKPQTAYYKKIKLESMPRSTREYKVKDASKYQIGDIITIDQILEEGDIVNAQGKTKGRGFTGVIKRWGFHGGPRTHGQSDRERAPGSIGQGTDPGRVHKGKKMPGHYGNETKTITNLVVLKIDSENNEVWVSGAVPGSINSQIRLTKVGKKSKFAGLPKEEVEVTQEIIEEKVDEVKEVKPEEKAKEIKTEAVKKEESVENNKQSSEPTEGEGK